MCGVCGELLHCLLHQDPPEGCSLQTSRQTALPRHGRKETPCDVKKLDVFAAF